MPNFAIFSDSAGDFSAALAEKLDVTVLPLSVIMGDNTYRDLPDRRDLPLEEFYERLQTEIASTNAVNSNAYIEAMTPVLQAGQDVLVLSFSSGLSATYQSSQIAVDELRTEFPERKIFAVDTLCASMGQALIVHLANERRQAGQSIEEVRDWVEANKLRLCHWLSVDDLKFLKRGGRISAATAIVGGMLSIKPIIHVDDEGHLISMAKARGRQAALKALVDQVEKTIDKTENAPIFISHSHCIDDARYLADMLRERTGVQEIVIDYIGPVIGAHTGPGSVVVSFVGGPR